MPFSHRKTCTYTCVKKGMDREVHMDHQVFIGVNSKPRRESASSRGRGGLVVTG